MEASLFFVVVVVKEIISGRDNFLVALSPSKLFEFEMLFLSELDEYLFHSRLNTKVGGSARNSMHALHGTADLT